MLEKLTGGKTVLMSMRARINLLLENRYFKWFVMIGCYAYVIYIIMRDTPTIPAHSDYAVYMNMVRGRWTLVYPPWSSRLLIPWIVSLLGSTETTFHNLNMLLMLFTCIILAYQYKDFFAPLLFIAFSMTVRVSAGEAGLDAAIYLFVAVSLLLVDRNCDYLVPLISILAALTHPTAFVIMAIIFTVKEKPHLVILGGVVLLAISSFDFYTTRFFFPDIPRLIAGMNELNILMLGFLGLKRDDNSYILMLVLYFCVFGTIIASNVRRVISPLGILLAPKTSKILRGWVTDEGISDT